MARVLTNYARLAIGLVAGVVVVRALLALGPVPYGVIVLLGVATGVAASVQEFLTTGIVPVTATAFHRRRAQPEQLAAIDAAAARLCRRVGFGVTAAFLLLAAGAPWIGSPTDLLAGCRAFLVARGIEWGIVLALAPRRARYLVTERTTILNGWLVAERLVDVVAAVIAAYAVGRGSPSLAIGVYGGVSAVLTIVAALVCSEPARRELRLALDAHPDAGRDPERTREATDSVRRSIGANSLVSLALNFYLRGAIVVAYGVVGPAGAYAFGLAAQFGFYLRQVAMGLVTGIDGIAARVRYGEETAGFTDFLRRGMNRQALVVAPVSVVVALFAEDLLALWAGRRLADDSGALADTALLVRLLLVGVAARALSDPWMTALSGVGYARSLAPPIVAGAGAAPPVCLIAALSAPAGSQLAAVAAGLSVAIAAVQLIAVPVWSARRVGVRVRDFFVPAARPAALALILALGIVGAHRLAPSAPRPLVAAFGLFVLYGPLGIRIFLDARRGRSVEDSVTTRSAA